MTKKDFNEKWDKILDKVQIDEKLFNAFKTNRDKFSEIFVDEEVIYKVIFSQNGYECCDYETEDYDNACEMKYHLTCQMYACGERDFCYYIKEMKREVK